MLQDHYNLHSYSLDIENAIMNPSIDPSEYMNGTCMY